MQGWVFIHWEGGLTEQQGHKFTNIMVEKKNHGALLIKKIKISLDTEDNEGVFVCKTNVKKKKKWFDIYHSSGASGKLAPD